MNATKITKHVALTADGVKVSSLTYANTQALQAAADLRELDLVTLTGSSAVFSAKTPAEALAALDHARDHLAAKFGTRGHPTASIPSTRRKLVAAVEAEGQSQD
ncbi:hypothetical protein HOT45_gp45 [Gordonia phage Trine]|uniref:Uncharacterized protein n=1 Tax=Gordonia phage Trine TaxID=2201431 RepID=A0A2Z4Q8X9_9CAUD|nr:hypothetical protein HOT45_gp45 [Gordonia phage Trine]AWY06546.1 hypothetical protein PBI_TRINE_45 [Gordonia phage Trine]